MRETVLHAVLWDFDGTLVDTRHKNLRVSRRIVEDLTGRPADDFEALRSLPAYEAANRRAHNWRDIYRRELGLDAEQTEAAGRMWGRYQELDRDPAPLYEGIGEAVAAFTVPQGIVSQNCREEITRAVRQSDLERHFSFIVGHECVPFDRQKPHPHGLFHCLEEVLGAELESLSAGVVLYVGDHEVDATCAANANREIAERGLDLEVISVAVSYGHGSDPAGWRVRPHHVVGGAHELEQLAQRLA